MTYRHHFARLEGVSEDSAIYVFTPNSIDAKHWGRVSFDLNSLLPSILELAPDSDAPESWQKAVCSALSFKLKKALEADPLCIPSTLEFIV